MRNDGLTSHITPSALSLRLPIPPLAKLNFYLTARTSYPTTETVIGEYNGKTLYRKIITGLTFAWNGSSATQTTINTGLIGIELVNYNISMAQVFEGGRYNRVNAYPFLYFDWFLPSTGQFALFSNATCEQGSGTVTLEYTKD